MVTITTRAAEMMHAALEQEDITDHGLRLVAQKGGCGCSGPAYGLFPEAEHGPEDTVFTEGSVSVFVDPDSLPLVDGATIDFVEHPEQGAGFTIQNPNAEAEGGGCGCSDEASAEGECECGDECDCQS